MICLKVKTNSGFIALISAIIISAILLIIVTNLSLNGFYSRFNILDSELKERTSSLAEACADTALLKLANDSAYVGGESVTVPGGGTCTIDLTIANNPRTFITRANYNNIYFTKMKIVVNVTSVLITSWEEI